MHKVRQEVITRRDLLRGAGALAALAPVAGPAALISGCEATADAPAYRPWHQKTTGALTDLEYIVQCGTLAPSPHNTQPWKFRLLGDHIQVFADRDRHLGAADAERRMMLMSIGCALENMCVAATQLGYRATVTGLDADRQFAESGYCATLDLKRARPATHRWFDAIFTRQTTRTPFDPLPSPPQELMEALRAVQDLPDIGLRWFAALDARDAVAKLSAASVREFLAMDQRHRDGMRWFRITRDEWQRHGDGIAVFNGDSPALVKQYVEWFATQEDVLGVEFKQGEIDSLDRLAPATPLWGLVYAGRPSQDLQVQAGRMAERVYLEAAARGCAVQPICYPTEIEEGRMKLRQLAAIDAAAQPLFLFRLGRSTHAARSVRRQLGEVILT
jgi:nitroreductase